MTKHDSKGGFHFSAKCRAIDFLRSLSFEIHAIKRNRTDEVDHTHFKRKWPQKVNHATFCTEWKSALTCQIVAETFGIILTYEHTNMDPPPNYRAGYATATCHKTIWMKCHTASCHTNWKYQACVNQRQIKPYWRSNAEDLKSIFGLAGCVILK
jgi:hypothetical protein